MELEKVGRVVKDLSVPNVDTDALAIEKGGARGELASLVGIDQLVKVQFSRPVHFDVEDLQKGELPVNYVVLVSKDVFKCNGDGEAGDKSTDGSDKVDIPELGGGIQVGVLALCDCLEVIAGNFDVASEDGVA